jgi:hypothetical protein
MPILDAFFKGLSAIGRVLVPKAKQMAAERAAAANPDAQKEFADKHLDEALQRLGVTHAEHAWWEEALRSIEGLIIKTDFIRLPHVQDWLSLADTQFRLKKATRESLFGGESSQDNIAQLTADYIAISQESRQHATSAITAVIAVLKASIQGGVRDSGVGALVQIGFSELHETNTNINEKLDILLKSQLNTTPEKTEEETLGEWKFELKRASTDLLKWPSTLHDGKRLSRPELEQLAEILQSNDASTTAVIGPPGAGKSALLAILGQTLQDNQDLPVLAIKADLLDRSISDEEGLQRHLGLPELPSEMLKKLSKTGPVILIIDQLDAIAAYVDIQTGRLSTLINLIRRVGNIKNIHTVLSSREFEFEHDVRLKAIDTQSLKLQNVPWEDAAEILKSHDINVAGWPKDAQEIVRNPQALNLYLLLHAQGRTEPFTTYQGMLDEIWEKRVLNDMSGKSHSGAAYKIANTMADEESLWLASSRFEDETESVKSLIAAGLICKSSEGSIGFSHQTIFEYALARHFAQDKGRLSSYALERQDSLFVRPKLWSALNYLRSREVTAYHSALQAIWSADNLRKHLRFLLIDFMGQQHSPTDQEEILMAQALNKENEQLAALRAISGSPGWLSRFAEGYISSAMVESEAAADATFEVFISGINHSADIVLRLIVNYWAVDQKNDGRILRILSSATHWTPIHLELAKLVILRTPAHLLYLDNILATLGASQPEVALDLLRFALDRQLGQARKEAANKVEDNENSPADEACKIARSVMNSPRRPLEELVKATHLDSILALAEKQPRAFVESIWPWFLDVFKEIKTYSPDTPLLGFCIPFSTPFPFPHEDEEPGSPPLLGAMVRSLVTIAQNDPTSFLHWMLEAQTNAYAPAQSLIALVLASAPSEYAEQALEFLIADTRRFYLGTLKNPKVITKSLVAACAPFWTVEQTQKFEAAVVSWKAPEELRTRPPVNRRIAFRSFRRVQIEILRSIPSRNRSKRTQAQVAEHERTFPNEKETNYFIGSLDAVMSADEMIRASNSNILKAFSTVPVSFPWDHPESRYQGGNIQLSNEFSDFAKSEPFRAKEILLQLPPESGEFAAAFSLRNFAASENPELAGELIHLLPEHGYRSDDFKSYASSAVDQLISRDIAISDAVVETFERWFESALIAPPAADLNETPLKENQSPLHGEDSLYDISKSIMWSDSISDTVPRGVYPIMSTLISAHLSRKEYSRAAKIFERYLAYSKDALTWEHLLYPLQELLHSSRTHSQLVLNVLDQIPDLIGTPASAALLMILLQDNQGEVKLHLEKWRTHPSQRVIGGFGELTLLAAMKRPDLDWPPQWLEEIYCEEPMISARAGAAITAVNVWKDMKYRPIATDVLTRVIPKGEPGVWSAIFDLFRIMHYLTPGRQTTKLLWVIADNIESAPPLDGTFIVPHLSAHLPLDAETIGKIALGLAKVWHQKLADRSSSIHASSGDLFNLATTLHRLGPTTRVQGLELFESLAEIDALTARGVFDELDNRFRTTHSPVRPRLKTRSQLRALSRKKGS